MYYFQWFLDTLKKTISAMIIENECLRASGKLEDSNFHLGL